MERKWFIKYQVANYNTGKWECKQYSGVINMHPTLDARHKEAMRCLNMLLRGEVPENREGMRYLPTPDAPKNFANTIQVLNEYLDSRNNIDAVTVKSYRTVIKRLHEWLQLTSRNSLPIGQLNAHCAIRFLEWMSVVKKYKNVTCNRHKVTLGTLWRDMIVDEIVEVNPWHQFKGMRKDSVPFKTYPHALQVKIKATLPAFDHQLYMASMAVYYDFIRPVELGRMHLFNIEWDLQCFRLTSDISKSKNDRLIVIPDELFELLLKRGYDKLDPSLYLFSSCGRPSEKQISKNWFNQRFAEYRKKYSIPDDYKLYGLKHTGNSRLGISGVTPQLQQKHNRHRDMKSIEPYITGISYEDMHFMRTMFPKFGEKVDALSKSGNIHNMAEVMQQILKQMAELKELISPPSLDIQPSPVPKAFA